MRIVNSSFVLAPWMVVVIVLISNCSVKLYQTFPTPLSVPEKTNVISVGGIFPNFIEYQKRMGKRFDLITGAGYLWSSEENDEDSTESLAHLVSYYLGTRCWLTNPLRSGFDCNFFAGYSGTFNFDLEPWQQFGGDIGVALGAHSKGLTFSLPLKIGAGGTNLVTKDKDIGSYLFANLEMQVILHGKRLGGGFRVGGYWSIGSDTENWLLHMPINCNLFCLYAF